MRKKTRETLGISGNKHCVLRAPTKIFLKKNIRLKYAGQTHSKRPETIFILNIPNGMTAQHTHIEIYIYMYVKAKRRTT